MIVIIRNHALNVDLKNGYAGIFDALTFATDGQFTKASKIQSNSEIVLRKYRFQWSYTPSQIRLSIYFEKELIMSLQERNTNYKNG